MVRDFVIALSLANLCFIKAWLYVNYILLLNIQYHSELPPNINYYLAVILDVLILALIFWTAITITRKFGNQTIKNISRGAFLLTLTIPINAIVTSYYFKEQNNVSNILVIIFILLLLILSIRMFLYYRSRVISLLAKAVLILFPFFLFNLFQPAYTFLTLNPSEFEVKPSAKTQSIKGPTNPRIVWIIFDEMDQRLTFEDRPPALKLPELDRFRSHSLYANNAYPPAGETDLSLPSLTTGKMISEVKYDRPNDLLIRISGENKFVGWSTLPNVFSKVYDMGFNSTLIGWYHPYGRVIGNNLTICSWHTFNNCRKATFSEAMAQQTEYFFKFLPLVGKFKIMNQISFYDELKLEDRIKSCTEIVNESLEAAVAPEIGLTLIHIPIPHPPGLYDSAKNDYVIKGGGYMDNLVLADRILGEIRQTMENSGLWEKTTVIITSDHWLRYDIWSKNDLGVNDNNIESFKKGMDYRVPYMIKLAGQSDGINYNQVFNTVLTHDLILAVLKNEVSSIGDVTKLIDSKCSNYLMPDYREQKKLKKH
ncbi:sulfatase-like hydrolase/transferase [Pelotomaculum propionicicum]|uniref:sulfatase-like hydrolase/transferase n=1 Tax=Pelotomaculum propionicicum TaxID=258475 RepID=UPI003B81479B